MQSYFEMSKSRDTLDFTETEVKVEAEAQQIEKHAFKACGCIPRDIRKTAIDEQLLQLITASGKTEVALLSVGSGDLGQEYHINKLLTENGIFVQWVLIDKEYGHTDASWKLLEAFKTSIEATSSGVLGAYSDISAYAAFKLGKIKFCELSRCQDYKNVFPKKWIDLMADQVLNSTLFKRKHQHFESNPLPAIDFGLVIDLNPTRMSGYEKTKALTTLTLKAIQYLNPESNCFSVINKNSLGAASEADLEIRLTQGEKTLGNSRRHTFF